MKTISFLALMAASLGAWADSPERILDQLQTEAGVMASAERGRQIYFAKFAGTKSESCSTCHTASPQDAGRHVRTHKVIDALAPSANPERFTDRNKVEKWFKRNCNEVLGRACTSQEKADFTAFVLTSR